MLTVEVGGGWSAARRADRQGAGLPWNALAKRDAQPRLPWGDGQRRDQAAMAMPGMQCRSSTRPPLRPGVLLIR